MSSHSDLINRWFHEVWGEARSEAAVDQLMAEDVRLHGLDVNRPLTRDDFKQLRKAFLAKYPDIRINVTHTVESGNWLAFRAQITATHADSGQPVKICGNGITQIVDGKFIETHETWDFASMFAQIGAVPNEVVARELGGA